MRVLITGASGATASQLLPMLSDEPGNEIFCADLAVPARPNWHQCDLADRDQIDALLSTVRPDRIYHLAGTFSNDYETDYRCNVAATKNLLDGCLALNLACRTLLIGSAAEYGWVSAAENPVAEDHPLDPVNVYGLTKVFQTHLMKAYVAVHRLDLVMARTFNLMGDGLSNQLFVGRLQEQIRAYLSGQIARIKVGNLDSKRDYIAIGQAAAHYRTIMNRGHSGEVYNVGSGESLPIRELLTRLLMTHGIPPEAIETLPAANVNKLDIPDIYANIEKLLRL
ncbi:NAD-dependent epimerase/dehydratase family protein [uncultured Thiodictyon sp.]|uniref:NAD-dependent epimerase/dehydratase family protein n=1 Tax=uncultured Thiodictyon sp. TaxID=1846217 RepID=UPI0025E8EB2A|nr:NAD-dependent epimerase/dehydratase family protein [uncultured Thiodictyon sp.]